MQKLREISELDIPFVVDSWWRSYCKNIKYDKHEYISKIKQVLQISKVLISCDPQDESVIHGWVCFSFYLGIPVIHYSYVKKPFRGFGIGKNLIESVVDKKKEFFVTHECSQNKYQTKLTSFILFPEVQF